MGRPLLNHLKTQTKNNLDFHRILELRLYSFFLQLGCLNSLKKQGLFLVIMICLLLLYCNPSKPKILLVVELPRFWIFFFGTLACLHAEK